MKSPQPLLAVILALFTLQTAAAPMVGSCPVFPANHLFNTRIDGLPVHPDSAAFIKRIGANYSGSTFTGTSNKLVHLDLGTQTAMIPTTTYYGIPSNVVNTAGNPALWKPVFFRYDGVDAILGYPDESDCALQTSPGVFSPVYPCTPASGTPTYMPIPAIGSGMGAAGELKIEGGVASNTDPGDPSDPAVAYNEYGDHHILTIDTATCTLWEAYHAYPRNGAANATSWEVLSIARFDLTSNSLRQDGATSADAAGFPIYPLLLRAEEASAGPDGIQHALRFTIQGSKVRGAYEWPARHKTGSNPADGTPDDDGLRPPMGQLFRLPSSFDITTVPGWPSGQSPGAQTIAIVNALKRYGMYIADNGSNMYIQGEASASWASSTFSQLQRIPHTAFEAVDLTPIKTRPGYTDQSAAVPAAGPNRGDFNTDNKPDLIWRNASGSAYVWYMNGPSLISDAFIANIDPSWKIAGVADFNGDGLPDLVWRNGAGNTYVWYMNGASFISDAFLFSLPPEWVIQGVADFNQDGKPDFLMRNTVSGNAFVWFFNNASPIGDQFLFNIDPSWKVEGVADLNADGQPDLLFRNTVSGLSFAWNSQYQGGALSLTTSSPPIFSIDPAWEVVQVADWNADGKPDLVFRNRNTGVVFVWYLNGTTLTTSDFIIQIDPSWEIVPRN